MPRKKVESTGSNIWKFYEIQNQKYRDTMERCKKENLGKGFTAIQKRKILNIFKEKPKEWKN